jgi:hypothetical protein
MQYTTEASATATTAYLTATATATAIATATANLTVRTTDIVSWARTFERAAISGGLLELLERTKGTRHTNSGK